MLLPGLTGGRLALLAPETMAAKGKAWPLIEGAAGYTAYMWSPAITKPALCFFADGATRRTEFTLNLMRMDESLTALLGGLLEQANILVSRAGVVADKIKTAVCGIEPRRFM
ncbi:phage tail protein [Sodalis sp. RH21]|uniref:phage tail protein n=1 Tax=unclassified Sodalis (in: enterobacteria) TaxID=2636512 RepID=UPI0039B412E7